MLNYLVILSSLGVWKPNLLQKLFENINKIDKKINICMIENFFYFYDKMKV